MKKVVKLLFVALCFMLICGCKDEQEENNSYYTITFAYGDGTIISEEKLYEDKGLIYPIINEEVGYNYNWGTSLDEINNAKQSMYVICYKTEAKKITKYMIDNEVILEKEGTYFKEVLEPSISKIYTNYHWNKSLTKVEDTYYEVYDLEYEYATFNVKYYYNDTLVELYPNTFKYGTSITLPSYEIEGKHFIGWFASDISLYRYTEISEDTSHDVILYARFQDSKNNNPLLLGDYTYLISDLKINKNSTYSNAATYNPIIPSSAPQGATNYEWSSLTPDTIDISIYSSLKARKLGYGMIQGVNKNNPNIVIKGVIKITSDGMSIVDIDEANTINLCKVTFVDKDNKVLLEQHILKGGNVIPPIPPKYDGLAFNGWDNDLYNINEDIIIKATYVEGKNDFVGKKVAIIGDSISTYYGLVPSGFATFYPYPTSNIFDYHDCWWMKTIDKLGAGLFVNNSYSGSCVATNTASSSTNDDRLSQLVINGEKPDVIIIYMGSNDVHSGSFTPSTFKSAYNTMLRKVKALCPDALIITCTLPTSTFYSADNQTSYNNVIKECSGIYNAKVVDLADVDISKSLVDSAHPQKEGMELISKKIIEELLS